MNETQVTRTFWKRVEDGLPPKGIPVVVFVGMPAAPSGEIDIGYINDDGDWYVYKYRGSRITHWMPVGNPPVES